MNDGLGPMDSGENRARPQTILVRSGLVTAAILAIVLLVLGLIWRQRGRGNLHRLTTPHAIESAPPVRPGGQEPITLSRLSLLNNTEPEFLSADLLPGLGMRILQLTVSLPDKNQVPLFASPELAEVKGTDAEGAPFSVLTDIGARHGGPLNDLGLAARGADQTQNDTMPDGGAATAHFLPTLQVDGATRPAGIDVAISVLLSGRALDLSMTARNTTDQNHVVELVWRPRFVAPSGNLSDYRLLVPSSDRKAGNGAQSVHGSSEDFSGAGGAQLGRGPVNATFVNLKRSFLGNGPVVELRDMRNNFALRMTALSPSIHSLHVETARDNRTVQLAYSTSDDIAGRSETGGATTLRPGQQLQWKVRVELDSLTHDRSLPQISGFPQLNQ